MSSTLYWQKAFAEIVPSQPHAATFPTYKSMHACNHCMVGDDHSRWSMKPCLHSRLGSALYWQKAFAEINSEPTSHCYIFSFTSPCLHACMESLHEVRNDHSRWSMKSWVQQLVFGLCPSPVVRGLSSCIDTYVCTYMHTYTHAPYVRVHCIYPPLLELNTFPWMSFLSGLLSIQEGAF